MGGLFVGEGVNARAGGLNGRNVSTGDCCKNFFLHVGHLNVRFFVIFVPPHSTDETWPMMSDLIGFRTLVWPLSQIASNFWFRRGSFDAFFSAAIEQIAASVRSRDRIVFTIAFRIVT